MRLSLMLGVGHARAWAMLGVGHAGGGSCWGGPCWGWIMLGVGHAGGGSCWGWVMLRLGHAGLGQACQKLPEALIRLNPVGLAQASPHFWLCFACRWKAT